jgi:hypothetical protein
MTLSTRASRAVIWTLFGIYLVPNVGGLVFDWHSTAVRGVAEWNLLAWGGFPLVGAMILSTRPGNLIGRLMLGIGLWQTLFNPLRLPALAGALPAGIETIVLAVQTVAYCTLILIVLIFPGGRFETRLSRVLFWFLLGCFTVVGVAQIVSPGPLSITGRANPFGIDAVAGVTSAISAYNYLAVPILLIGTVLEIGIRWARTKDRVVRLQLSWFTFGIVVTVITTALSAGGGGGNNVWLSFVSTLAINAIPAGIFIAITRYGLYSIGRVVSRAVTYVLVTAVAVGIYAGIVLLASTFVTGNNPFLVAIATLIAAAVFLPLLRVVQRGLDRRFDRRRYDAEQVVETFGERLRNAVDPETTMPDLVAAVGRALQPASLGLWIRRGDV